MGARALSPVCHADRTVAEMTRRRTLPVVRWLQPCPDCAATFDGNGLRHEDTCPLAAGVDAVCDADAAYFEAHPDEWYFTRPISAAELQTMAHLDPAGAALGPNHVHVLRVSGGRIRQFCNHNAFASVAIDPDTDDEAAS